MNEPSEVEIFTPVRRGHLPPTIEAQPVPADVIADPSPPCENLTGYVLLVCLAALAVAVVALLGLFREPQAEELCQELLTHVPEPARSEVSADDSDRSLDDLVDPDHQPRQ